MPRKADEFEVLEKPKRAPRKRAPKPVAESSIEKPKRTRTTKKEEVVEQPRRAPTALKEVSQKRSNSKKHLIVVGVLLVIGIGSSAIVGLTDKGQIDVVTMIEERNRKAEERGEKVVSTSIKDQLPDGGLVPADQSTSASSTPPVTASTTASTTPQGNIPRTAEEVAEEVTATST